jgi:hypothetical protein
MKCTNSVLIKNCRNNSMKNSTQTCFAVSLTAMLAISAVSVMMYQEAEAADNN